MLLLLLQFFEDATVLAAQDHDGFLQLLELIGPDGRAWAASAHASSSYGAGRTVRKSGDGFVLEDFVLR